MQFYYGVYENCQIPEILLFISVIIFSRLRIAFSPPRFPRLLPAWPDLAIIMIFVENARGHSFQKSMVQSPIGEFDGVIKYIIVTVIYYRFFV